MNGNGRVVSDPQILPAAAEPPAAPAAADVPPQEPPTPPAGGLPWEAPGPRRAVIPAWLSDQASRLAAARWLAGHIGHHAAFHAVRVPHYSAKIVLRAPVGAGRIAADLARWLFDRDEAGTHHLRVYAAAQRDAKTYATMARIRKDRVRTRMLALVATAIATVVLVTAANLAWPPSLLVLGVLALIGLGWHGQPRGKRFAEPAVVAHAAERLTPDIVVRALNALGLAEINKNLREGRDIQFTAPVQRDGPGWRAELNLPFGVTVSQVMERREQLASGLRRPLGAVWPEQSRDGHAGHLVLWVGDQSMARARQPAWPLMKAGKADLFSPLPFGTDPHGRNVPLNLMYSNLLTGGLPGAGKTMATRVALLGAALDPTCELRIHELAGKGDLSAFERIAYRYGCGVDDATIEACLDDLRAVHAGLERRSKKLADLPRELVTENKVTRQIADRTGLGLHPLVMAISECQEIFSHPEFGKEAGDLATAIIKRGRALAVILLLDTQRPDAGSLPTGVSVNAGMRFGLRLMDHDTNDRLLGSGSYKSGLRATMFSPDDAGIGWLIGAGPEPRVIRSYYINAPAADKITLRARQAREAARTLAGYAAGESADDDRPARNVRADVLAVFGSDPALHWPMLAGRLAGRFPDRWADATGDSLSADCRALGIPSVDVRWPSGRLGANRKGCRRSDIDGDLP